MNASQGPIEKITDIKNLDDILLDSPTSFEVSFFPDLPLKISYFPQITLQQKSLLPKSQYIAFNIAGFENDNGGITMFYELVMKTSYTNLCILTKSISKQMKKWLRVDYFSKAPIITFENPPLKDEIRNFFPAFQNQIIEEEINFKSIFHCYGEPLFEIDLNSPPENVVISNALPQVVAIQEGLRLFSLLLSFIFKNDNKITNVISNATTSQNISTSQKKENKNPPNPNNPTNPTKNEQTDDEISYIFSPSDIRESYNIILKYRNHDLDKF